MQARWTALDDYFSQQLHPSDEALDAARREGEDAGLPPHQVSACQGAFLALLVQVQGAARVLEIGTLGGESAIWMARSLPSHGRLISLEIDPERAKVARRNLARAGLQERVEVRTGDARHSLSQLLAEGSGPFDFVFIDADKPSNPNYLSWALRLTRPGSLIVVDNVVRNGAVCDRESDDPSVRGVRAMIEQISREPRLRAAALQTVGSKGYDGFLLARVVA
jgi:predicted O-methyltransferase YrrM